MKEKLRIKKNIFSAKIADILFTLIIAALVFISWNSAHAQSTFLIAQNSNNILSTLQDTYKTTSTLSANTDSPKVVEPGIVGRLRSIKILITKSSLTQKVEQSHDPEATEMLAECQPKWLQAKILYEEKRQEKEAHHVLDEVVSLIKQIIKILNVGKDDEPRQIQLFRSKESTTIALTDAFKRIATEKGKTEIIDPIISEVMTALNTARQYLNIKNFPEAHKNLNYSYQRIKVAVYSLRNGDTLESRKEFNSPEEEYNYELDRNHSYFMLIDLLISDKKFSVQTEQQIKTLGEQAISHQAQARIMADNKKFESAITELMVSSRLLARALRLAGVYIPD